MATPEIEILIVEDNADEAKLIIRSLGKQNLGQNILHVSDGLEALDFIFAQEKFGERKIGNGLKVILLDLKLQKIDGLEVLRQIRAEERTKLIPVVVLTGSKEDPDVLASYELGVNSYVIKPIDNASFAQAVATVGMYWMTINELPQFIQRPPI